MKARKEDPYPHLQELRTSALVTHHRRGVGASESGGDDASEQSDDAPSESDHDDHPMQDMVARLRDALLEQGREYRHLLAYVGRLSGEVNELAGEIAASMILSNK